MKIKESLKTGISFGLTSAVITILGLMVGLNSSTSSKKAVIGGVLVIAIADALSDATGIHMSEESENKHTEKEIWQSTFWTFFGKLFFGLTFIVPLIFLELKKAVFVNIFWGFFLLSFLSYFLARLQKKKAFSVIFEHLLILTVVIFLANFIGGFIAKIFS